MKVVFCTPTVSRPHDAYLEALERSLPAIEAAGWEHQAVFEVGNPYISYARANTLRKALTAGADVVVFIDHDLSWAPGDLLKLIETPGDVVAGTYRYKKDDEEYMGSWRTDVEFRPMTRDDGCCLAERVPAGFLKVTKEAVHKFMSIYPDLTFGPRFLPAVDLFNHGVIDGVWYGEDMAFSKRWREAGGEIWLVPDLSIDHHRADKAYSGNLSRFLAEQDLLPKGLGDVAFDRRLCEPQDRARSLDEAFLDQLDG
jgi:glycosyltransferase involved in cell wall biosynthesis